MSTIGQIFEISIKITDVSRATPLEQIFWIETIPFQQKSGGGKGGKKTGQGKNNSTPGFELPPIIEVFEVDWPKHTWNKESVFKFIKNNNGIFDTYINMDNIHILSELKTAKNEADKDILKTQYTLGLALISMNMSHLNLKGQFNDAEKSAEDVSKALGPVIIPMIRDLGSSISS